MTHKSNRRIFLATLAGAASSAAFTAQASMTEQYTTLFDGKNLDHWDQIAGGKWRIEEGVLIGSQGEDWTTDPEKTGSYLRSKKAYGDFELLMQYSINEGGNSGVFFRSAKEKNPAYTGYEMQITDVHGKEANQYNAGIYDLVAPRKNVYKPAGEWNQVRIRMIEHHIVIDINGERVIDFTGDRRLKGHIGLQNHDDHSVVRFRKIRIRAL